MKSLLMAAAAALTLAAPMAAQATVVLAPVSAVVEIGGDAGPDYGIGNVFDQSGLSEAYESGVTDFDEFLSFAPMHSTSSSREWFAAAGQTSARIVFDLGAEYLLSSLALWNEDAGGAGTVRISTLDKFLAEVSPTDNAGGRFYPGERFDFGSTLTRYVVLELSDCPHGGAGAYNGCSIGELAFGGVTPAAGAVPEPGAWALMILGFGLTGAALRRRSDALRAA